jgi:protein ImuA
VVQAHQSDIVQKLKLDLLRLGGMRTSGVPSIDSVLGPLREYFPCHTFPCGVVHEFLCQQNEECAATAGFISHLLNAFMRNGGISFWVGERKIFPPALKAEGIQPDRIFFVDVNKEKDVIWTIDEALKCTALTAVIGQVHALDFTASRRLQLAAEQSGVTCFLFRRHKQREKINPTASVSRWRITHLPSVPIDTLPGIGLPQWKIELLRIRNGRTGTWNLMWDNDRFVTPIQPTVIREQQKKAG